MNRFLWGWGAFVGAILLPLAMLTCLYVVASFFPHPRVVVSIPQIFRYTGLKWSLVGAGLGFCSSTLRWGKHHQAWRVLSALYGAGTTAYGMRLVQADFASISSISLRNYLTLLNSTFVAPVVLWGMALLFFSLTMRTRPVSTLEP